MPSILRSRVALLAMFGVFLIPIGTSSLRGLTHVLTCQEEVATPFTLLIPEEGDPILTSSIRITADEPETLCEEKRGAGLVVEMGARTVGRNRIAMVIPIRNQSEFEWRGTIKLILDRTSIPVDIGAVPAGTTVTEEVPFKLKSGQHEMNGSLLIGP